MAVEVPIASIQDSAPRLSNQPAITMAQRPLRQSGGLQRQTAPTQLAALTIPVFVVIFPMTALTIVLIGLVFGYQVKEQPGIFPSARRLADTREHHHILVNFSATRLVFLASWLSTLAPILAGPLMKIWRLQAAQSLQISSVTSQTDLPTMSQFSSLVGLLESSSDPLLGYYWALGSRLFQYRHRTTQTAIQRSYNPSAVPDSALRPAAPLIAHVPLQLALPPSLSKAATMVTLCTLLATAVFAADTWLDVFTETVRFEAKSTVARPSLPFGRSISPKCLDFDRSSNFCFPCSYAEIGGYWSDSEIKAQHSEMFLLQHNSSLNSEIQVVQMGIAGDVDLAILMPQAVSLPEMVDFRSSTIGVSTQCSPISSTCNMRVSESDTFHTQFNCSRSFWGVLGKPPNITEINVNKSKAIDPDLPGLDWKPSSDLQYGYFTDATLADPYNPIGYNPATGDPDPAIPCTPDDRLLNPVYLGVAGRFAVDSEAAGSLLSNDSGVWQGPNQYIDFALSCSYTTYNVNYTWVNGTIQNVSYKPTPNGSISEIFHGMQVYDTISGGDALLQDYLIQAALQNTSTALAREWGLGNTVWVLSTIAAYTVPRITLQEQTRTELLVAQIPIAALAALVASSFMYVVFASVLGFVTYRYSQVANIRYIATQLNRDGLCTAAFGIGAAIREMASLQGTESNQGEDAVGDGQAPEHLAPSQAHRVGMMQREHYRRVGISTAGDSYEGTPFAVFDLEE